MAGLSSFFTGIVNLKGHFYQVSNRGLRAILGFGQLFSDVRCRLGDKTIGQGSCPNGGLRGQSGVLDKGLSQPIKKHGWVFVGPLSHLI